MEVGETAYSRLTLCDDGILEAHPIQRRAPRNAALLTETMGALTAVAGGKSRPVLWDPAGTIPIPPDGWQTIVERVKGVISALAIVIDPDEAPLLGRFPESMNMLLIPVRIFNDATTARRWLLQFVEPD